MVPSVNEVTYSMSQAQDTFTIYVDFDETFINENFLIKWVLFVLLESGMSVTKKLFFSLKSFYRGVLSLLSASHPGSSKWGVRLAYKTFEEIEIDIVNEFISYERSNGHMLSLNTKVIRILEHSIHYLAQYVSTPHITIYSQGTFKYAIETLLKREDVATQLKNSGITIGSVRANTLKRIHNKFTGELSSSTITKHTRVEELSKNSANSLFIGDNKDEEAIKKIGKGNINFLNYSKVKLESLDSILRDVVSNREKKEV